MPLKTEAPGADVLIVGAGFVGAAMAIAFDRAGISSIVVDAQDPARTLDDRFDGRAFAIARSSRRLLEGIGVWPDLEGVAAPILDIRVSDAASPFFLHYDSEDTGEGGTDEGEPFGHMVRNVDLRRALAERLADARGATLIAPARVADLHRDAGGVSATLDDGRRIRARLAVAADGRHSEIRRGAHIKVSGWSYDQVGIVCTVDHERCHDFIAHERFLPAGPFAILPLLGDPADPGRRASIVWTERAELAPRIMALDDDGFAAELERRFGDFLGTVRVVGGRWSHPLSLQFAETQIAERLALVGDAAHAMHPIAGQGLNMGLRDVAALAEVAVDRMRLGLDIGDGTALATFQRWRRFDNALMLAMTDGLNRLFSNGVGPIKLARDLGLAAVNRMGPAKAFFTRHAMGTVGDLPRLMRGETL